MHMRIFHMCSVLDSKTLFRMYWSLKILTKKVSRSFYVTDVPKNRSIQHRISTIISHVSLSPGKIQAMVRIPHVSHGHLGRERAVLGGKDAQLFGDEGYLPTDTGSPGCNKGLYNGIHGKRTVYLLR